MLKYRPLPTAWEAVGNRVCALAVQKLSVYNEPRLMEHSQKAVLNH